MDTPDPRLLQPVEARWLLDQIEDPERPPAAAVVRKLTFIADESDRPAG